MSDLHHIAGAYADQSAAMPAPANLQAQPGTASADTLPAIPLPTLSQIKSFIDLLPRPAGQPSKHCAFEESQSGQSD